MTDPIATTLRTWAGDADEGDAVEVGASALHSAADHIDYLAGVIRSMEVERDHDRVQIARLRRELENKNQRRVA